MIRSIASFRTSVQPGGRGNAIGSRNFGERVRCGIAASRAASRLEGGRQAGRHAPRSSGATLESGWRRTVTYRQKSDSSKSIGALRARLEESPDPAQSGDVNGQMTGFAVPSCGLHDDFNIPPQSREAVQ